MKQSNRSDAELILVDKSPSLEVLLTQFSLIDRRGRLSLRLYGSGSGYEPVRKTNWVGRDPVLKHYHLLCRTRPTSEVQWNFLKETFCYKANSK